MKFVSFETFNSAWVLAKKTVNQVIFVTIIELCSDKNEKPYNSLQYPAD